MLWRRTTIVNVDGVLSVGVPGAVDEGAPDEVMEEAETEGTVLETRICAVLEEAAEVEDDAVGAVDETAMGAVETAVGAVDETAVDAVETASRRSFQSEKNWCGNRCTCRTCSAGSD